MGTVHVSTSGLEEADCGHYARNKTATGLNAKKLAYAEGIFGSGLKRTQSYCGVP